MVQTNLPPHHFAHVQRRQGDSTMVSVYVSIIRPSNRAIRMPFYSQCPCLVYHRQSDVFSYFCDNAYKNSQLFLKGGGHCVQLAGLRLSLGDLYVLDRESDINKQTNKQTNKRTVHRSDSSFLTSSIILCLRKVKFYQHIINLFPVPLTDLIMGVSCVTMSM